MTLFEDGGPQDSLEKAKRQVRNGRSGGVFCPCCGMFNKEYPRKLHSSMAAALIWIVRAYDREPDWIFVNKQAPQYVLRHGRDWTLLRHWGLIHEKPRDPEEDQRTSGLWKPTQLGILFAHRKSRVRSHALTFDNECLGLQGELVGVEKCLGNKFSYRELMGYEP